MKSSQTMDIMAEVKRAGVVMDSIIRALSIIVAEWTGGHLPIVHASPRVEEILGGPLAGRLVEQHIPERYLKKHLDGVQRREFSDDYMEHWRETEALRMDGSEVAIRIRVHLPPDEPALRDLYVAEINRR